MTDHDRDESLYREALRLFRATQLLALVTLVAIIAALVLA